MRTLLHFYQKEKENQNSRSSLLICPVSLILCTQIYLQGRVVVVVVVHRIHLVVLQIFPKSLSQEYSRKLEKLLIVITENLFKIPSVSAKERMLWNLIAWINTHSMLPSKIYPKTLGVLNAKNFLRNALKLPKKTF